MKKYFYLTWIAFFLTQITFINSSDLPESIVESKKKRWTEQSRSRFFNKLEKSNQQLFIEGIKGRCISDFSREQFHEFVKGVAVIVATKKNTQEDGEKENIDVVVSDKINEYALDFIYAKKWIDDELNQDRRLLAINIKNIKKRFIQATLSDPALPVELRMGSAILEEGFEVRKMLAQAIDEEYQTAFHEAAHVVASLRFQGELGDIINLVTIEPRGDNLGFVSTCSAFKSFKPDNYKNTVMFLAGGVAEELLIKLSSEKYEVGFSKDMLLDDMILNQLLKKPGLKNDLFQVDTILKSEGVYDEEKKNEVLIDRYRDAFLFILNNYETVEAVARHLFVKGTLSGDEIYNGLKISKPLFENQSGPLPEDLVGDYEKRKETKDHITMYDIYELERENDFGKIMSGSQYKSSLRRKPLGLPTLPKDVFDVVSQQPYKTESFKSEDSIRDENGRLFEID